MTSRQLHKDIEVKELYLAHDLQTHGEDKHQWRESIKNLRRQLRDIGDSNYNTIYWIANLRDTI